MKTLKRLTAMLIAVSVMFALSISVFAALVNTAGYYTFEVKVEDANGAAITSAATGTKAYLAVYLYATEEANRGDISIAAHTDSQMGYNIIMPLAFCADGASIEEWGSAEFNATLGTATLSNYGVDYGWYLNNEIPFASGATISPSVAVAKHEITLGEIGTYTIALDDTYSNATSGASSGMTSTLTSNFKSASFTITGAEPEEDKIVVNEADGKITVSYPEGETGALAGQTLVKADLNGTALTSATRFVVTYDGEEKTFGATMWEELGIANSGTVEANNITVAVAFNFDVDTSKLTIARQN